MNEPHFERAAGTGRDRTARGRVRARALIYTPGVIIGTGAATDRMAMYTKPKDRHRPHKEPPKGVLSCKSIFEPVYIWIS